MRTSQSLLALTLATTTLAAGGAARAQDMGGMAPATSTPMAVPPAPSSHGSMRSGRAGMGVGAIVTLSGTTGATFAYDTGQFHVTALLGFLSVDNDGGGADVTSVAAGGRFFWHLHRGDSSDFGVGGGLTLIHTNVDNGVNDNTEDDFQLEGGAEMRAFVSDNVALSGSIGLAIVPDSVANGSDVIAFGGQVIGAFGMTYFFY